MLPWLVREWQRGELLSRSYAYIYLSAKTIASHVRPTIARNVPFSGLLLAQQ